MQLALWAGTGPIRGQLYANSPPARAGRLITTLPEGTAPAVSTAAVTKTASEYAECGGTVTDAGGGTVSGRGCCWNTNGSPTLADAHSHDGEGLGSYASVLRNLTGGAL